MSWSIHTPVNEKVSGGHFKMSNVVPNFSYRLISSNKTSSYEDTGINWQNLILYCLIQAWLFFFPLQ